ncbi:MAG: hypothetical protein K2W96_09265 [Gemmataceae bacterium]|nr:hypothetical protein [Gemmataceae bacterium]
MTTVESVGIGASPAAAPLHPGTEPASPRISAFAARQCAKQFIIMDVSSQVATDEPTLVPGDRPCWRVPLLLTMPRHGSLGQVGELLVDADTGEVLADEKDLARINDDANSLARRSSL